MEFGLILNYARNVIDGQLLEWRNTKMKKSGRDCATVRYEIITVVVSYFANGTIHYKNPKTGELLFTRQTPKKEM